MSRENEGKGFDARRRRLLKSSALIGGALAAGRLPYSSPRVQSFIGAGAWAQTTFTYSISCTATAQPSAPSGPTYVCDTGTITSITATVSPVPPVGTLIVCTPTSTDPLNPTAPTDTAPTDAAGVATFFDFDVFGAFSAPPLANGSVLTLTASFDDPATFGPATCSNSWTVETCV